MEQLCGPINRLLVGPPDSPPWSRFFRTALFLAAAAGAYLTAGVLVFGSPGGAVVLGGSVLLGALAALSVSVGTVLVGVSLLRDTG
jgi:hypothetical protein